MKKILRYLAFAAALVSCGSDEAVLGDGEQPESGRPLEFIATMEGMQTRSAEVKTAWAEGDVIGVKISTDAGKTGQYSLNADGTVKEAITSVSWQASGTADITAWYPFEDKPNVDIKDQTGGYAEIDFLGAELKGKEFTEGVTVELPFKHLMTKVQCKLVAGDGITDADLSSATVEFSGATYVTFSEGTVSGSNYFSVKPYKSSDGIYSALLVPHTDKDGYKLITVTVGGNKFYYKPAGGVNLEAGKQYNYKIKVKKTGIEVESVTIGDWTDDAKESEAATAVFHVYMPEGHNQTLTYSSNVTVKEGYLAVKGNKFTISYIVNGENGMKSFSIADGIGEMSSEMSSADGVYTYTFNYTLHSDVTLAYTDYIKVGDFYYSDGTWLPYKDSEKTCIGIVFKAGAGDSDQASNYGENKLKDNTIHGYVVALTDAHADAGFWGIVNTDISAIPNEDNFTTKYNGYTNTVAVRQLDAYKTTDVSQPRAGNQYWAFKAASEYNVTTPSNSSGWYLPSIGQLKDIYELENRASLFTTANGSDYKKNAYWSSTEKNGAFAWYYNFYNGKPAYEYSKMTYPFNVRAVLTF